MGCFYRKTTLLAFYGSFRVLARSPFLVSRERSLGTTSPALCICHSLMPVDDDDNVEDDYVAYPREFNFNVNLFLATNSQLTGKRPLFATTK